MIWADVVVRRARQQMDRDRTDDDAARAFTQLRPQVSA